MQMKGGLFALLLLTIIETGSSTGKALQSDDAKRWFFCVLQSRHPIRDMASDKVEFICLDSAYRYMIVFSGETGFLKLIKYRLLTVDCSLAKRAVYTLI